jgi:hypothetical protein
MNAIDCPYCEAELPEDSDCREQDIPYETECPHCGKSFIYYIEYYPSYTSYKAPCLNGEPHDYQPVIGFPKEYYEKMRRCSFCSKEIELPETERQQ